MSNNIIEEWNSIISNKKINELDTKTDDDFKTIIFPEMNRNVFGLMIVYKWIDGIKYILNKCSRDLILDLLLHIDNTGQSTFDYSFKHSQEIYNILHQYLFEDVSNNKRMGLFIANFNYIYNNRLTKQYEEELVFKLCGDKSLESLFNNYYF